MANHNRRRRDNRAIRRNVAEWARAGGYDEELVGRLLRQPPNVAKEWIKAKGCDPQDFLVAVRPGPVVSPPPPPPPAPVVGVASNVGTGSASGSGSSGSGFSWSTRSWPAATSELDGQIQAAMAQQGGHRDERSLLSGEPTSVKTVVAGTNTTRLVELDNGVVGYFKPFGGEDRGNARGFGHDGPLQSLHEAAAWRLASQMGPPWSEIVPPVVIREMNGEVGSFALERPGKTGVSEPWHAAEWREAAFFDALIGQQDRHPQNYLMAGDRLTLIDHGYTFATPGDYQNWSWFVERRVAGEGGDGNGASPALTYQEREVLQRLVSSPDLLGLSRMLQLSRALALKERAHRMLDSGELVSGY